MTDQLDAETGDWVIRIFDSPSQSPFRDCIESNFTGTREEAETVAQILCYANQGVTFSVRDANAKPRHRLDMDPWGDKSLLSTGELLQIQTGPVPMVA